MKKLIVSLAALMLILPGIAQQQDFIITPPAEKQYTHIDKQGKTVIPNGRIITPAGKSFSTAPHPYGLAVSRDGSCLLYTSRCV